ncbi:hypothetical protein FGO68_gene2331 [Halteria grandinella]|uniref:Uncharacterized protein n=1 Tax=Halteria grandinella TaxID=5974 RepID=A0A8J8NZE9_HALGN|nr:hypothetical protein FGO68_gene2331 [Halteria grandinella]
MVPTDHISVSATRIQGMKIINSKVPQFRIFQLLPIFTFPQMKRHNSPHKLRPNFRQAVLSEESVINRYDQSAQSLEGLDLSSAGPLTEETLQSICCGTNDYIDLSMPEAQLRYYQQDLVLNCTICCIDPCECSKQATVGDISQEESHFSQMQEVSNEQKISIEYHAVLNVTEITVENSEQEERKIENAQDLKGNLDNQIADQLDLVQTRGSSQNADNRNSSLKKVPKIKLPCKKPSLPRRVTAEKKIQQAVVIKLLKGRRAKNSANIIVVNLKKSFPAESMRSLFRLFCTMYTREAEVRLLILKNLYIFATGRRYQQAEDIFRKLMLQICFSTTISKDTHSSVNKEALNKVELIVKNIDKKQSKAKTPKQRQNFNNWKTERVSQVLDILTSFDCKSACCKCFEQESNISLSGDLTINLLSLRRLQAYFRKSRIRLGADL